MTAVDQFYSRIQFPGHYASQAVSLQVDCLTNPYLRYIDQYLGTNLSVLDVGCGTGLVSNIMAQRHPDSQFTGIDFADSVYYAQQFATQQHITNVDFIKQDFLDFAVDQTFDRVICQGVLHHIPNSDSAVEKLQQLVRPGGLLLLGLYHPWGKVVKRFAKINYGNHVLYQDQELNPYETSYRLSDVLELFDQFDFVGAYPCMLNRFVALPAFFNYRNGGLVTYALEKKL